MRARFLKQFVLALLLKLQQRPTYNTAIRQAPLNRLLVNIQSTVGNLHPEVWPIAIVKYDTFVLYCAVDIGADVLHEVNVEAKISTNG